MMGGREKKKPATVGRVPLHRVFAFADRTDAALMAVGAVAALANGMAQPLMTFIFGDVIDAFGSTASANVLHRVVKVRNQHRLANAPLILTPEC
jgi:ATP-binding cassette, subfamily B (MDR/TAP), member 1